MSEQTWVIPHGDGNEHVICEGDNPHQPGRILFIVRPPMGTSAVPSYEQLAEYAARAVRAVNAHDEHQAEILRIHKEKCDNLERAILAEIERDEAITNSNDRIADLQATISSLTAENAAMRKALEAVSEGDVPRPLGERYRSDDKPSKNDTCRHGLYMYEECGCCISDFARAALATPTETDAERA